MYLTFTDYITMGGVLTDENLFNDLEYEAESLIDHYTFNRLKNVEYASLPEEVKKLVKHLITLLKQRNDALHTNDTQIESSVESTATVKSQSNDGVSVTYQTLDATDSIKLTEQTVKNTINRYLSGIKLNNRLLLYRGLYPDE